METLIIRLDGIFDLDAAHRLLDAVAGAPRGAEIYLDLTHLTEFHDRAVAVLAEALAQAPDRVAVHGLRQHQYRMLRYLGVDPRALSPSFAARSLPQPVGAS